MMPEEEVYDPEDYEDWFTKGLGDENKDEAEANGEDEASTKSLELSPNLQILKIEG
jgi:hypothetical protein